MKLPQTFDNHSDVAPQMRFAKKFRVFFVVASIVGLLSIFKAAVHWFGLEFLTLNTLLTSGIAGAIFILGFLLSSVLSDYKEAERIPTEIRVALEAIHGDVASFAAANEKVNLGACRAMLKNVVHLIREGLDDTNDHSNLRPALEQVEGLNSIFVHLEQLGFPTNYIVRLRTAQDSLRRAVSRIYHIQKVQFVPSVHILAQSLVTSIVLILLFLKTEGSPESALMFGFICYLFVYALYLIRLLEQPFLKGHNTFDDVSLFLLTEFVERLRDQEQPARHPIDTMINQAQLAAQNLTHSRQASFVNKG
jgi:hypothetical protein